MTRILAKVSAATALSAALITFGLSMAGAANAEGTTPTNSGSGQSSLVQTGSGTGSAGIDLPTAMILCTLTGGDYKFPLSLSMMPHGPSGCFGGLMGMGRFEG